jgi:hypothetical protein
VELLTFLARCPVHLPWYLIPIPLALALDHDDVRCAPFFLLDYARVCGVRDVRDGLVDAVDGLLGHRHLLVQLFKLVNEIINRSIRHTSEFLSDLCVALYFVS